MYHEKHTGQFEMNSPYKGLSAIELRILKLYNDGLDEIDIAEEMQMDEAEIAAIIDRLDTLGYTQ